MSWVQMLYDTYEYCTPLVGVVESENKTPLLPIAHTTQNAHIEIIIDLEGQLLSAGTRVITDKKESITIIPCTEESQSRSGTKAAAYPLFDKLQYLAGDYSAFGGSRGDDFHIKYMMALAEWCNSIFSNPRICVVLKYLQRGTLMADLVKAGILPVDAQGKVIQKWAMREMGEKQGVFKAGSSLSNATDAFVRIDVHTGNACPKLWLDPEVWDSWKKYYATLQGCNDTCYVQGKEMICSDKSPAKIRNTGDKAKLISSNDTSGFTFRGRFTDASQVVMIGYETTQKAHNALKWLITRQGFTNGKQVYVAWGTRNENLPKFTDDTADLFLQFEPKTSPPNTQRDYALRLNRLMSGYKEKEGLENRSQVVVLGVDSATDSFDGRLSIIYYRELSGSDFLQRIEHWHHSCAWLLRYKKIANQANNKAQKIIFVGAPAPIDIILAAYGRSVSDKLKKSAFQRIIPCILDGAAVPVDIMHTLARRASNPVAMEYWEYQKTLSIACALIKKYHNDKSKKEVWQMNLDENNTDRSYLFGRILAYYNNLESWALALTNETRQTNAVRLKYQFSRKPAKTLEILDQKCIPYLKTLGSKARWQIEEKEALVSRLNDENGKMFTNEPLTELFLLGYDSQMTALRNRKTATADNNIEEQKGE